MLTAEGTSALRSSSGNLSSPDAFSRLGSRQRSASPTIWIFGQRLRADLADLTLQRIGLGPGFFHILMARDGKPHGLVQGQGTVVLRVQRAGRQRDQRY